MNMDSIAAELMDALDHQKLLSPVSDRVAGFDLAAGYDLGARLALRRMERGEQIIGRKLGFTNQRLWDQLGVDAPFWSFVYDSTVTFTNAEVGEVSLDRMTQPRLEPELVLHFASAPPALADEAALLACIDWVAPAFEVVQCHFPDWRFGTPDAVADSGLHGALVVGPPTEIGALDDPLSLADFSIVLSRDGEVIARGGSAQVLGSPLRALAYVLTRTHDQAGWRPLRAGDIVTTGTLTGLHEVDPGEHWEITTAGIPIERFRLRID